MLGKSRCRFAGALAALLTGTGAAQQTALAAGKLLARDGTPAVGAHLELRHRVHPELPLLLGQVFGDRGLGCVTATTDAEGRFRVELPHRGPFELTATAATGEDRVARIFPVMAGDFVEARFEAPFVVAGQVRDGDGAPVPNLTLDLVPHATSWSRLSNYRLPELRGSTVTDAEGRFRLVMPAGYLRTAVWEPFVLLQPRDLDTTLPVNELLRPTAHCQELGLARKLAQPGECTVLTTSGAPAPEVTLLTADTRVRSQQVATGPLHWRTEAVQVLYAVAPGHSLTPLVDAIARFLGNDKVKTPPVVRLRAADPRRVRLAAAAGPLTKCPVVLALATEDGSWVPFCYETDRDGAVLLDVLAANSDLQLHVAIDGCFVCAFRGLATALPKNEAIRVEPPRQVDGQVLDRDGAPVPHARVLLHPAAQPHRQPYFVTYTDRGGRFVFPSAPRGALWFQVDAGAAGLVGTQQAVGATAIVLRVAFRGELTGEVRDGDGNPLPHAWVSLSRSGDAADNLPAGPRDGLTALTFFADGNGHFTCRGLPAGTWNLHANTLREQRWLGAMIEVETGAEDLVVTCAVQRD